MRQVYPGGSALTDAALAALYDYPDLGPPPARWLRANMVASLDGAATADGRSGGLSGEADRQVFAMLRAHADVILVGAGTARAERYAPVRPESEGVRWAWLRDGRPLSPPIAVVTRELDLDLDSALIAGTLPHARTIIITTSSAMPGRRDAAAARNAEVIIAGEASVDMKAAVDALAERGLQRVSCEGGPHLLAQLADAGLLDELCLTISPLVTGPGADRIVTGGLAMPGGHTLPFRLVHVLEDESYLLCRYVRPSRWLAVGAEPAELPQDVAEVEADRLFKLLVGARLRVPVGPPADELGGVPEPPALHVVVAHLDHPLRAQRDERQVLARVPAADLGLARRADDALRPGPVPRVPLERGDQGLHLGEQLPPLRHRERADHAYAGQLVLGGVQAEQQRADRLVAGLVRAVPSHHAVGGALVLDLEHDPLVRLVPAVQRLGDEPVQPGALELGEPLPGQRPVAGRRGDVQRCPHPGQGLLQHRPALRERPLHVVGVPEGQQVEGHEPGRGLAGQQVHPARRRVDPLQQRLEVEPRAVGVRDHDLPVDHAPLRQLPDDLADKLGKVPRHRALVAAADLHLVTVAEDDGPEPVPFRLVAVAAVGYRLDRLGEHRRDRRADRKLYRRILPD